MAGADGVDVAQFHELEVLQDVLPGGVVAGIGVVFMQVHALELDGLAIDQEGLHHAGCPVIPDLIGNLCNLQAAETHVEAGVFPVHAEHQGVELGRFGAPAADFRNPFHQGLHVAGELVGGIGHGLSVLVQQLIEHLRGLCGRHLELKQAGGQIGIQGRNHLEIEAAVPALAGEVHVPFQAGDAPEILVFQPGGLGVAVNLEHQLVLSGLERLRNAEAGQVFGILAVAYFLSVHIHVGAALAAAEIQIHLAALPTVRNGETAPVQGGGNGFRQNTGNGILRAEVIQDIGVDGGAPSLDFPVAGNLNFVPGGGDVHLAVVFKILEVPGAVQALVVFAFAETFGEGILPGSKVDDFRPPGFRIHGCGVDVLPERQSDGQ